MNNLLLGVLMGVFTNLITAPIMRLMAFRKARSIVWPVDINAIKVTGPEAIRLSPKILVATFSGIFKPRDMDEATFRQALKDADLNVLPIDENTPSMGSIIRAIKTYPTLKSVYLITTRSRAGHASAESASLFERYCSETFNRSIEILAKEDYLVIDADEDPQVIRESYDAVKTVFAKMRKIDAKGYQPKESRIIVDVTGGTKSMSTGAILACLRPDQDIHLIGSRYDDTGRPVESFPLLVTFKPDRSSY